MFAYLTKSQKLVDRYHTGSPTPVYLPLLLSTAMVAVTLASLFNLPEILALAFELSASTMPSARQVDSGARHKTYRITIDYRLYYISKNPQR